MTKDLIYKGQIAHGNERRVFTLPGVTDQSNILGGIVPEIKTVSKIGIN